MAGTRATVRRWVRLLQATGIVTLVLAFPANASATLGRDTSSVDADRVRMQGALLRIARSDTYTIHEMRSSTGTTVREYVSSSGTVFAVTWQGPWLPDLRQVLGAYFDDYQRALQATAGKRRARGSLTIDQPDLMVQASGHPRAFSGRAFVPRLMPLRVQPETIR
jgi:Protein of unknown function (DUF2844)